MLDVLKRIFSGQADWSTFKFFLAGGGGNPERITVSLLDRKGNPIIHSAGVFGQKIDLDKEESNSDEQALTD